MTTRLAAVAWYAAAILLAPAAHASAQRYTFERTFDVTETEPAVLDIVTERGRITITEGDPGRVVVVGVATVRIGWNVPADAPAIAQGVAARPPIDRADGVIRLRPPADDRARRAVTVAYTVRVPKNVEIRAVSDSGAVSIRSTGAPVLVRTQSSAIELAHLDSSADVTTGSGAVTAEAIAGDLRVTTASSAISARDLGAGFRGDTGSGAIEVSLTGPGDVDVRTRSSAITLSGVRGALTASTQSGRTIVSGSPLEPWSVSTGSGAVDVTFAPAASATVNASTGSGSVRADDAPITGSITTRRVEGTIAGGGPMVRLASRSGSIRISRAP